MRTLIVGSGLIGVTTAYLLARRGHVVTVIDRAEGPGLEASYANGGLLTPSMADPWNAPGSWRLLLASPFRSESAVQLRLGALPSLLGWGVRFLRDSSPERFERNTRHNLRLALYSLKVMESLREHVGVQYGYIARGSLRVFRGEAALRRSLGVAAKWVSAGLHFRGLSVPEMIAFEPALSSIAEELAGGIHYAADEIGDAYQFCAQMRRSAEEFGARFHFGTTAQAFSRDSKGIKEVITDRGRYTADRYVIAAGSHSAPLARGADIHLPVRPVKGYSLTLAAPEEGRLRTPIVDDELHAVITPLGNAIRVAGTAEFAGYDLTLRRDRINNLVSLLRRVLPHASFNFETAQPWCGLRPMSADGVPIVGRTPIANLFLSTGHGHLGWTMAAGSARMLTDLICGEATSIDPAPYALARFETA